MKKIIYVVVALLVSLVLFCACDVTPENPEDKPFGERIVTVAYDGVNGMIVVDKETRVMYLFVKHGYGGGLTVLVDADGNPLLYEGELP